jgi:hypothetical protein
MNNEALYNYRRLENFKRISPSNPNLYYEFINSYKIDHLLSIGHKSHYGQLVIDKGVGFISDEVVKLPKSDKVPYLSNVKKDIEDEILAITGMTYFLSAGYSEVSEDERKERIINSLKILIGKIEGLITHNTTPSVVFNSLSRKNDMTNVTHLPLTNSLLDSSCNPFISFKVITAIAPPFDTYPLEGYEKQENFPNCCDYHKAIFNDVIQWLERFPNCCEAHREIQKIYNFDKEDFKDLPLKVLNQSDFTRFHIHERLESEDWYEDITQYLTWNLFSFGEPNIGYYKYILIVKDYLLQEYEVTKIDENKAKLLIKYIDDSISINPNIEDMGFDMVYETYKKWLEVFPFDIPYFRDIKDEYSKKYPAFDGKLVLNRYTGLLQGKAITKDKLIAYLIQTTKDLLDKIQPRELFRNGIISDITKYNFYLESLNINHSKIVKAYTEKEFEYVSILELWLNNFKSFFKDVEPLLTKIHNDNTPLVNAPLLIEKPKEEEKQVNHFCNGMPMSFVRKHFEVLTTKLNRKKEPLLTLDQFEAFINRAFHNENKIPKIEPNMGKREDKLIREVFYKFYSKPSVKEYDTKQNRDNYIKLLTENIIGFELNVVRKNFNR